MSWYREISADGHQSIKHKHLIVRAETSRVPDSEEELREWTTSLISKIGMELVSGPHIAYIGDEGNRGFTCVSIIKTSHVSLHIWDELSPKLMQLDVYSCSNFNPRQIFEHLRQFEPVKISYKFLNREHGLHEMNLGWKFRV